MMHNFGKRKYAFIMFILANSMRWAERVAFVGDRRGACRVWWGYLRERERERVKVHLEDQA